MANDDLKIELAKLLSAFPMPNDGEVSIKLRLAAYVEALGEFPSWAVSIARVKFTRGVIPDVNKGFAPTPPQFAEVVRAVLADHPTKTADGAVGFDGEIPMTWVLRSDARWDRLCALCREKHPERPRPVATMSKYAKGEGRFFRTAYLDEVGYVAPRPEPKMADPEKVQEVFGLLKGDLFRSMQEDDAQRSADTRAAIERGNARAFAAACARDGLDPSSMASPALLRSLGQAVKPMPGDEEEAA